MGIISEKVTSETFSLHRLLSHIQKPHLKLNIPYNNMSTILCKLSIPIVLSGDRGRARCAGYSVHGGSLLQAHNRKTLGLRTKAKGSIGILDILFPGTHWRSYYFTVGQASLHKMTLQSHFYNARQLPRAPSVFLH